jgi:EAL and modified HD-GYP domain-containing signal transduction protein
MNEHPVLSHVLLGYSPVIDRQRAVVGTRVTVFPVSNDQVPDAHALLLALQEVWPAPDQSADLALSLRPLDAAAAPARFGAATPVAGALRHPVSLNVTHEALLRSLMQAVPPPHFMVEVPAFMASDPANAEPLRALRESGTVLLIKGRPLAPLSPEVLGCFSHSIVEAQDDRRGSNAPPVGVRQVTTVQSGVRTSIDIEQAFSRGAVSVLGWPFDDPAPKASVRAKVPTDIQVVMQLIQGVDREDPVSKLEDTLRRDPTLAFRLLRYLNSPAFGLSAEINSFSHAIMMLGYQRLKRWLAVLLASSSQGSNGKPLMHAAVRRGLMMEELSRSQGDAEMRGEMFLCGVFSLLDQLLQQPFSELLGNVPVPDRVQQTLRGADGPYAPYLELVRAIEQESSYDIRECSERLMLGPGEVNRALLVALQSARLLDG